jgi:hypothetical protein
MLTVAELPFPSSVELVLGRYGALVDTRAASALALEAAVAAMAPAQPRPRSPPTSSASCTGVVAAGLP